MHSMHSALPAKPQLMKSRPLRGSRSIKPQKLYNLSSAPIVSPDRMMNGFDFLLQ